MAMEKQIRAPRVARDDTLHIAVVLGGALLNQVFTILRQQWGGTHAA
jgi:hypothetical protein